MTNQKQNENLRSLVDATDNEILEHMKASKDVSEWNERREVVKNIKGNNWVAKNIDVTGLIGKTKIK